MGEEEIIVNCESCKKGLLAELSKIHRVCGKAMESAPHEVLLVLDGTVGQNARAQAEQFLEQKLPVQIAPHLSVQHGIDAVRVTLPYCWFNLDKCSDGVEALRVYRRKFDEINKVYLDKPLHDWASDYADAFRYLALVANKKKLKPPAPHQTQQGQQIGTSNYSLDDLFKDRERNRPQGGPGPDSGG